MGVLKGEKSKRHHFNPLKEVKNKTIPNIKTMVAPDGRSSQYDANNPATVIKIPVTVERSMSLLRSWVNRLLMAAGMVNSAMTKMMPTTLMRTTTLNPTRHSNAKYRG